MLRAQLRGTKCYVAWGAKLKERLKLLSAQMQDAGKVQAQTLPVDCSNRGFVLTDVDQGEPGTVIIRQTFLDAWGVTNPPRNVDYQADAIWSIGGKVLVQCNPGVIAASIEVR
jgi:hypothetical protein